MAPARGESGLRHALCPLKACAPLALGARLLVDDLAARLERGFEQAFGGLVGGIGGELDIDRVGALDADHTVIGGHVARNIVSDFFGHHY